MRLVITDFAKNYNVIENPLIFINLQMQMIFSIMFEIHQAGEKLNYEIAISTRHKYSFGSTQTESVKEYC